MQNFSEIQVYTMLCFIAVFAKLICYFYCSDRVINFCVIPRAMNHNINRPKSKCQDQKFEAPRPKKPRPRDPETQKTRH